MKDELMDIYDENKNLTGKTILRKNKDNLLENEYVISVHCFIINSSSKILLTQRSLTKNRGGMWEDTHGGLRSGETSIQGIQRELYEELGITVESNELILFKTSKGKNNFRDIYILKKDIPLESFSFNDGEVMDCKYVTIEELKKIIKDGKCTFTSFEQTIFYDNDITNF